MKKATLIEVAFLLRVFIPEIKSYKLSNFGAKMTSTFDFLICSTGRLDEIHLSGSG